MDTWSLLIELLADEHIEISNNTILDIYLDDAKKAIKKFSMLSEEEYVNAHLEVETAKLAKYRYINRKYVGVKNVNQGRESRTFENNEIPNEIKANLPNPPAFSF